MGLYLCSLSLNPFLWSLLQDSPLTTDLHSLSVLLLPFPTMPPSALLPCLSILSLWSHKHIRVPLPCLSPSPYHPISSPHKSLTKEFQFALSSCSSRRDPLNPCIPLFHGCPLTRRTWRSGLSDILELRRKGSEAVNLGERVAGMMSMMESEPKTSQNGEGNLDRNIENRT